MNHCVPDWRRDQKKSTPPESELVELIWRNGNVVTQSHSNTNPSSILLESRHEPKFDPSLKHGHTVGSSSNLIQEDEPSPWLQDPLDDSLDREFSEFFSGVIPMQTNTSTAPPPKFGSSLVSILSNSKLPANDLQSASGAVGELSSVRMSPLCGARTNTFDPTVTSSSGGSRCSFGKSAVKRSATDESHKRKGRYAEDSECGNKEGDYESIEGNMSAQRSASKRKSRAAEIHNLSERRRREKINEKMKALQELIPHCNKSDKASMLDEAIEYLKSLQLQSDKASMLDEAIEYLKSLQLQVQMMWMGSGMAQMIMLPSAQQYMPRAATGMGHASMPSIDSPIQLRRTPLLNHSIGSTASANLMSVFPSTVLMQNAHVPEPYARYVGFPQMQSTMNSYAYGSNMERQKSTAEIPSKKIKNGWSEDSEPMFLPKVGSLPKYLHVLRSQKDFVFLD